MAAQLEDNITTNGGLFDRAVLLSVTFNSWGRSRKLKPQQYQVNVDDKAKRTRASKKLLEDSAEIKAIQTLYSETRQYLDARAAVCSALKGGVYLWPVASLVSAMEYLDGQVVKLQYLTDDLSQKWNGLVNDDLYALQGVGDPNDYPTMDQIRRAYSISYVALEAAAPGALARVDMAAYQAAQERAGELWQSALDAGKAALVEELDGMLSHLVEVLNPSEDGTKRKFHKTSVTKIDDWVALYRDKSSILQDANLDAAVERVKAMMSGVSVEALKNGNGIKETVSARASEIRESLAALVVDAPIRRIALLDEDI